MLRAPKKHSLRIRKERWQSIFGCCKEHVMDAPRCRLCGNRHWNLCPDSSVVRLDDVVPLNSPKDVRVRKKATVERIIDPDRRSGHDSGKSEQKKPGVLSPSDRSKAWRERHREKTRAYMREYMAKRRSREKLDNG